MLVVPTVHNSYTKESSVQKDQFEIGKENKYVLSQGGQNQSNKITRTELRFTYQKQSYKKKHWQIYYFSHLLM